MKDEEFCIECEVLIQVPTALDRLVGNKALAIKYKSGWKCAKCAKR